MNPKWNGVERRSTLRKKAEAMVGSLSPDQSVAQPSDVLLHELLVHKVELEIQNEELRRAHTDMEEARDRYADLYEFAPIGYFTINRDGLISEINLTGAALLGIDRSKLINRRFSNFITPPDQDRWYRLFINMIKLPNDKKQELGLEIVRADGSVFYAHLDCLRRESLPTSPSLRIALIDISKIKQAEKELRIAAAAFESQEGMFITDANNVILRVNQAFTTITGYSAEDAIGKTPSLLKSGRQDATFYSEMRQSLKTKGAWRGEMWNRRKNGEIFPEWQTITVLKGDDGEVLHYIATLTDITQEKVASEQIEKLAFFDPLTNLPNRRLLKNRLHLALAFSSRNKRRGALLFIDLDNFKLLNDTLGHNIGDLLLQQVAQRLINCIREVDTAARLGGDEFVVMLEDLSESLEEAAIDTEIAGKKLLAALNEPYLLAGHEHRCSASIGATLFYNHSVSEDELLQHVDIAMYQAKHAGRNTLCFFDQAMQSTLTERATLETDLRHALEQNQFKLYYQMQTTHDGKAVGAEVLIRWHHPAHGLISPMAFIPLAEETGLILPIGQWALETACAQLKAWENNPKTKGLRLAVNVSAHQFHQSDFVEQVRTVLEKTAIDPQLLTLELTESVILKDRPDTIAKMQALRINGIRFSLDDFGTGYSSLAYLTQLPLDQIKIDQSFVRNIGIKHNDSVIVQTIIAMANTLAMNVIAEGVETEEQRIFLEQYGCNLCQGYLFSKPVPAEDFEALLS
ncbi:MAG: EAL domain-containing protein [Methylococcaceae bacterium]|nr:EAL domain-containing protein [Methylococcaceae bacterium]